MGELIATLRRKGGEEICRIPLPRTAADVTLARYVSFLAEADKIGSEAHNGMHVMARAVHEFTGAPLDEILLATVGAEWDKTKSLDEGVRTLYGWIVNAVGEYKGKARTGEDFEFEHKGSKFTIPFITQSAISGRDILADVETIEMIEAMESVRNVKEEIEAKGDPDGSFIFTKYLRVIACLCRKDGQRLPIESAAREQAIQDTVHFLTDIDAQTALDVDFFLKSLFQPYGETGGILGFLSRRSLDLAAETKRVSAKHITVPSNIKRRRLSGRAGITSRAR